MNFSLTCQDELKQVIMKRITKENVDKQTEIMSSNLFELYFGVLAKFT